MVKKQASLYFHVPFCTRKCPYCHFFVVKESQNQHQIYLEALSLEWEKKKELLDSYEIVSIYFGGGTPALLKPEAIQSILQKIPYSSDCEITLEANPETIDLPKLIAFKAAGINRISLGVQSFDDAILKFLGRTHSAKEALIAIENVPQAGIHNLSIDLMYEIPHQTFESFQTTLSHLKNLPLAHLSLYNLELDHGSAFSRQKKRLLPLVAVPETARKMLEEALFQLNSYGLHRYEISAFAKPGFASRHNVGYWQGRPFLGLGPSAFSYWDKSRFQNVLSFKEYVTSLKENRSPIHFEETLPYPSSLHELFAVEIRLLEGIEISSFEKRHGTIPESLKTAIDELVAKGVLVRTASHIKLTSESTFFYDSIAPQLI